MCFVACALLVIAIAHATNACTSGETREDDSESCSCSADSLSWRCTPNSGTCEPETFFKYYCNVCHCPEDGQVVNAVCTRFSCDHNKWNKNGTQKYHEENDTNVENDHPGLEDETTTPLMYPDSMHFAEKKGQCRAGNMFRYFCNFCYCRLHRRISGAFCTANVCDITIWNEDGTLNPNVELLTTEHSVESPKRNDTTLEEFPGNSITTDSVGHLELLLHLMSQSMTGEEMEKDVAILNTFLRHFAIPDAAEAAELLQVIEQAASVETPKNNNTATLEDTSETLAAVWDIAIQFMSNFITRTVPAN